MATEVSGGINRAALSKSTGASIAETYWNPPRRPSTALPRSQIWDYARQASRRYRSLAPDSWLP
jgi:hypothetical protein